MEILSIDDSETIAEQNGDDRRNSTAPYYEPEAFDSVWQALQWKQIRARIPACLKKTLRSRYMFANLVYLVYAIGILLIDFNSTINEALLDNSSDSCENDSTKPTGLDQPTGNTRVVNHFYIGMSMRTKIHIRNLVVF